MCCHCQSPSCCSPSTCAPVVVSTAATVTQLNTLKAAICAKLATIGSIINEVLVDDRVRVKFEGFSGDVTATYDTGLATIDVENGARLLSVTVYGAAADLDGGTQGFQIRVNNANIGNTVDNMDYPVGIVLDRDNQTTPTQGAPMTQNTDPSIDFTIHTVSSTGLTAEFTPLDGLTTHALLLKF